MMRCDCRFCLVSLLLLGSCRQPPAPRASHLRQVGVTTQPVTAASLPGVVAPPSILLRGALAPPQSRQSYQIELRLSTELSNESAEARTEAMHFEISGDFVPIPTAGSREASLTMTIDHLSVKIESVRPGETLRTFAFESNNTGEPGPLHRLLTPLVGASLGLWVTPTGELQQLRGVTQLTRDNRLAVPTELATIVALLNDASFDMMVAHCLFPPLPSSPLERSYQWQFEESSFPLDPCPLTATMIGSMVAPQKDSQGLPVIGLEAAGAIQTATADCPIRLIEGREQVWRHVSWNDHSIVQQMDRSIQFGPRDRAGDDPSHRTGRYVRQETWISRRAGAATQTRPG